MRDYWLSKLFFDVQSSQAAGEEYRADSRSVLDRYPLKPAIRTAIEEGNVAVLAPLTNPYLLRLFFVEAGMPEKEFVQKIRATATGTAAAAVAHG